MSGGAQGPTDTQHGGAPAIREGSETEQAPSVEPLHIVSDDRATADAALIEALDAGRPCALATVVATKGSTPRKAGARMVIDPALGIVGTVGGGCGEAEVIETAKQVLETGRAERVRVDLTDDLASWSPAVCGGIMDVFVEPVTGITSITPPESRASGPVPVAPPVVPPRE